MIALLIALAVSSHPQVVHPCDVTPPTVFNVPANQVVPLSFCQPPKKTEKGEIVPVDGFVLTWNGGQMDIAIGVTPAASIAAPIGTPSPSSGKQEYRTTLYFSPGDHALELRAFNLVNGNRQLSVEPPEKITVKATLDQPPVDCVVSEWSEWSAWKPINATTMERRRTRTELKPAQNGGSCVSLVEVQTMAIPTEECGNNIDDDFDGQIDEGCAPPTSDLTVSAATTRCRFTTAATPPDTSGGWRVQFRRDGVNFGNSDASPPYTRTAELTAGTYQFSAVWSKTGQTAVTTPAVSKICP